MLSIRVCPSQSPIERGFLISATPHAGSLLVPLRLREPSLHHLTVPSRAVVGQILNVTLQVRIPALKVEYKVWRCLVRAVAMGDGREPLQIHNNKKIISSEG